VGAVLNTIPSGVLGGATLALYGLIGVVGIKIWLDNKVDFSKPKNQFTAAVALVIGVGNLTWMIGDPKGGIQLGGIVLGTIAAIVIYHLMNAIGRWRGTD
jgi:NCS2 family nucleobase:cation symporter-2